MPPPLGEVAPQSAKVQFVPLWVRVVVVSVVALLFALSVGLLLLAVYRPEREGWADPAAAFAETSGTAFLVLLLLFFIERGQRLPRVEALSNRFFVDDLPRALEKIAYVEPRHAPWHRGWTRSARLRSRVAIEISHASGSYRAEYIVTADAITVAMTVELNVQRLGIVYLIPGGEGADAAATFGALADTFEGARDAGYHIGVPRDLGLGEEALRERLGWPRCLNQALHRALGEGFLYDPVMRQFVAQDIAIMTRSLIREGASAGLLRPERPAG